MEFISKVNIVYGFFVINSLEVIIKVFLGINKYLFVC